MKLARLGPIGHEQPVVVGDDATYDLRPVVADLTGDFWADDGVRRAADALAAGRLPVLDPTGLRVGAPVARPSAVVCIGMNYAAHAAESGAEPPTRPVIFLKTPNTVVGPNDSVQIPRGSTKTDWEVELAVVIGRRTAYLDGPEQSLASVAGFTICDDLSERAYQLEISGGQWGKGKSCPGFCPTGPWVVTPDEVDHTDLRLRSWVNGDPRQDSSTADLIFGVEQIIFELSQHLTLEPGDLVLTGTPQGVALSGRFPFLKAGDVVELDVAGLGRQRHEFVEWSAPTTEAAA